MKLLPTDLPGVVLIEPGVFGDARGYFKVLWSGGVADAPELPASFVQDNLSRSGRGTLRGLHLQHPHGQGKLVSVLHGEVYDVAVDVRRGSPHFGRWTACVLSEENHRQLYIPPGFAHGFCVTSESALFHYKCTDTYHPETEFGVAWDDPELAIPWPVDSPRLSDKDARNPPLSRIDPDRLPAFEG